MKTQTISESNIKFSGRFWLGLIIFGFSWLSVFQIAKAQNPVFSNPGADTSSIENLPEISLNVSPPINYISVQPGETKSFQLTLQNYGKRNLEIQLSLAEFESNNLTGQPIIKPNSKFEYLKPKNPAWSWLRSNLVKSGETVKVIFDITVPTTAKSMEYHLTILAQAGITSAETTAADMSGELNSTSSVTGLIGSNLILAIAKDSENLNQIVLTDWEIPRYIDSLGSIDIQGLVKNTGNQSGPILGRASLIGPGGKLLKSWLVYPDMVLPNSSRTVRFVDTTQDPAASSDAWLTRSNVKIENSMVYKPNWLFGNYTLKIQLFHQDYTDIQPYSEKIVQITALPYGILAIIIVIPVCFGLFLRYKSKFGSYIVSKTRD